MPRPPLNHGYSLDHSCQDPCIPVRQQGLEELHIRTVLVDNRRITELWLPILDEHPEEGLLVASFLDGTVDIPDDLVA